MKTITITDQQEAMLRSMLEDMETGYIANPSRRADKLRDRYRAVLAAILAMPTKPS